MVNVVSSWVGIAQDDYTLKLAVFHTIFNTIGIVVMMPFINQLVNFLHQDHAGEGGRRGGAEVPQRLGIGTARYGDRGGQERNAAPVRHAFAIISHGLSLHRHDILSDRDLEEVVQQSRKPMPIDLDEEYNASVKGLYGEIVHFISRAQATMNEEQADELFRLRAAGRDIVEAIKDTKHMHKNLVRYIATDNADIRNEYNRIRVQLGEVLRRIGRGAAG